MTARVATYFASLGFKGERQVARLAVTFASVLCFGVAAAPAPVRASVSYDASQGTLPTAQGWTLGEDIMPPMAYPVGVASGDLHLSTLGFGSDDASGGGVWWQRTDVSIDFANEFAVEVSTRIASAPDHSVNMVTGGPRPGYAVAIYDVNGRLFWVGLGSNEVFLANTVFGHYGTGNTVTTAFNTTDAHHVYRIERAPGGVGAALRIDGVIRLQLPALGPVENSGGLIYFGDPTYWANSESYTSWVSYSGATLAVEPTTRPELLWAAAAGCPTRSLGVAFRCEQAGALAFDLFDAAGRQVARSDREVAAGQSGSFEVPGARGNGIYYYRVRLNPGSGRASEVTGRIVLIR